MRFRARVKAPAGGPRADATGSIPAMHIRAGGSWGSALAGGTGVRGGTALSAVAMACAVLVGGCGSSTPARKVDLNVVRVERAIKRSILAQRHLSSTVVCQSKVEQKPGKFVCIATTVTAKKPHKKIETPFVVTIHNTKGYVTYIGR